MEKAIIIIPTYNEKENIPEIIERLQEVFKEINNYEMGILFFDSNSPDGTAKLIREYQKNNPNIYLIEEHEKSGLGNAYIQAFKYAENVLGADIVFEFDADGSHKPEYLPAMMLAFSKGADVVLGSRYVKGGSIPKDWALHRKLLSVLGNIAARFVLSHKIKDYTTGFRGTRISALKKIDFDKLKSKSYAYKIHLLWQLFLLKQKIVELPIDFIDRTKGVSKLPKNNMIESLLLIFTLRFERLKTYFKTLSVGCIGVLIQLIIFNILRHVLHPAFANACAVEAAIISNFILNNHFSFAKQRHRLNKNLRAWFRKLAMFNFFSLGSLLLQTLLVFIGLHLFGSGLYRENAYIIAGIVLGSIYNYKIYRHIIWK